MPTYEYKSTVLPNGLRVFLEKIPYVRSVSVGVWIRVGSRVEEKRLSGISHFLEHMFFKGTSRRSCDEISEEVDSLGAQIGASTNREYTCLYARTLDEHLPRILDILSDILLYSTFDSSEIEREKKVVLEEIRMLGGSPDAVIHDLYAKTFWEGHPLGEPVIGTEETVTSFTREDITSLFDKFYSAKNTIITIAGNFDCDESVDMLSKYFCGMRQGKVFQFLPPEEPKSSVIQYSKELNQIHLCLGTKGISQGHDDRFAAYLIDVIMGSGISSRLFKEIREKKGLCYSIYSYFTSFSDSGTFAVYCTTNPKFAGEVVMSVLKEFRRLREVKIEPGEFERKKERLKGNLMLSMENINSRMIYLAKQAMYFDGYCKLDEIVEEIDKVKPSDVKNLSEELFQSKFINLVSMGDVGSLNITVNDLKC